MSDHLVVGVGRPSIEDDDLPTEPNFVRAGAVELDASDRSLAEAAICAMTSSRYLFIRWSEFASLDVAAEGRNIGH